MGMRPLFVKIKCELGKTYEVADQLVETIEETSEVYSVSGDYDILAKFYLGADADVGHFVAEKVQTVPHIKDTFTMITFKVFSK
jgi:DNA-binding Lrp family transcriptional regulator